MRGLPHHNGGPCAGRRGARAKLVGMSRWSLAALMGALLLGIAAPPAHAIGTGTLAPEIGLKDLSGRGVSIVVRRSRTLRKRTAI